MAKVSDDGQSLIPFKGLERLYEPALKAADAGASLASALEEYGLDDPVAYEPVAQSGRLLVPLDHPDEAHLLLTGTGLTHLGSAQSRNAMHVKLSGDENRLTDSMRIFKEGLEGGKPAPGEIGFQPEWFYKGDGLQPGGPPGQPLVSPSWALDGGEEAEIVGLYVISSKGEPCRVGFALGNEFSDHVMEKGNYLNLSHKQDAQQFLWSGTADRRPAPGHPGPGPDFAAGRGDLVRRPAQRRGQHEPRHRQPGAPPVQVRRVPPSRRRLLPLFRDRAAELQRWDLGPGGGCVRNFGSGSSAGPWPMPWRSPRIEGLMTVRVL